MRFSNVLNFVHISRSSVVEVSKDNENSKKHVSCSNSDSESSSYIQVDPDLVTETMHNSAASINTEPGLRENAEPVPELYSKLIYEAPFVPAKTLDVVKLNTNNSSCKISDKSTNSENSLDVTTKETVVVVEEKENSIVDVDWIDPELIIEGRKFIRRNFFCIIFAHMIALAFLLAVKPIQSLLLRTGAIHNKENSLTRYLLTILHVKRWYESDLLEPSSEASEDILAVRKMYEKAAKNFKIFIPPPAEELKLSEDEVNLYNALKEDMKQLTKVNTNDIKNLNKIYTTVNPDVPMSHYDMAVIQFAFFGFISLFPKVFGIHESKKKHPRGVEGFVHIWAILGRLLGMEDRFNLCLKENFDEKTNKLIFQDIFLFSFKLSDSTAIRLWKAMTAGSYRYFFFFRTKSMLLFMARSVAQVEHCKNICALMNWVEKMCYFCYRFTINWTIRLSIVRIFLNLCSRIIFYIGNWLYVRRSKRVMNNVKELRGEGIINPIFVQKEGEKIQ